MVEYLGDECRLGDVCDDTKLPAAQRAQGDVNVEDLMRSMIDDRLGTTRLPLSALVAVTANSPCTATGALVGGLLGNQIGGGSGKKIATVVGTAAVALAGNKIQERAQANDVVTKMERQCHMVTDLSERVSGYDVTYMIGAVEGNVRMDQKPGERIPLDNGELAIN